MACACGDKFLPHLLAQHQRSCPSCHPAEPAEPVDRTNGGMFVACEWCDRTFFPERLPVHQRSCPNAPSGGGIRPTITSSAETSRGGTIGEYSYDPARRRKVFQLGAALGSMQIN